MLDVSFSVVKTGKSKNKPALCVTAYNIETARHILQCNMSPAVLQEVKVKDNTTKFYFTGDFKKVKQSICKKN